MEIVFLERINEIRSKLHFLKGFVKKSDSPFFFFSGHLETGLVSFRFLSTTRTLKRLRNGSKGEQIVNDTTTTTKKQAELFLFRIFLKSGI